MFKLGLILAGLLHLGTTQTIQANICSVPATPAITSPASGTKTSTQEIEVSGTATPSTTVSIIDDGSQTASIDSDGSGNFGVDVQLVSGSHNLVAQVSNDCGQTASSSAVTVTYTPPNPPPAPPPASSPAPPVVSITKTSNPTTFLALVTVPTKTLSSKGLSLTLPNYPASANSASKPTKTVAPSVFVTGRTGVAANVAIIVNGKVVADVLSNKYGVFGIRVPLRVGKNTVEFAATLGDKTLTKTLYFTRTAPVTKGSTITGTFLYTGVIIVIAFWVAFFAILLYRRRKRRAREEQEAKAREGVVNAPVSL